MFILEKLVFQGENHCPKYLWTQYAICESSTLLEKIRAKQVQPSAWRVTYAPFTLEQFERNQSHGHFMQNRKAVEQFAA